MSIRFTYIHTYIQSLVIRPALPHSHFWLCPWTFFSFQTEMVMASAGSSCRSKCAFHLGSSVPLHVSVQCVWVLRMCGDGSDGCGGGSEVSTAMRMNGSGSLKDGNGRVNRGGT